MPEADNGESPNRKPARIEARRLLVAGLATVLAIPVLVYDNISRAADAESSEMIVAGGAEAPLDLPAGPSQSQDSASPASERETVARETVSAGVLRSASGGDDEGDDELLTDPWFWYSSAFRSPASSTTTAPPTTTAVTPDVTTTTAAPTTTAPAPPTTAPPPPTPPPPPPPSPVNSESGQATWYSHIPGTCAHKTLPFGTVVTVRNMANGATTRCVVGDRGPFGAGRIIDLDPREFAQLAPLSSGVINVTINW